MSSHIQIKSTGHSLKIQKDHEQDRKHETWTVAYKVEYFKIDLSEIDVGEIWRLG